MLSFTLLIIGLFFGSFFLVLIDRLPKQISPFTGRSKCDHCSHTLQAWDLIPVLSFLSTRGRCRYCHRQLSVYYPALEILTGILFAVTPYLAHLSEASLFDLLGWMRLVFLLWFVSSFIIIFFIDLRSGIIPFLIVIPSILIAILYHGIYAPQLLIPAVLSSVGAGLFFFLIFYVTRGRGMGFGDVVLALYLGMLLPYPLILLCLYIAFLTGAGVSLILITVRLKKLKGSTIPFGPFLILGAYCSLFWGEQLTSYLMRYVFHLY